MSALPPSAVVAVAIVTEAVINPAIKSHRRSPISIIKTKTAAAPTPIARSPKVADLRCHHPCARHPVIFAIPGPVPRRPDITVAWANRLFVNGHLRWRDRDRYADLRGGRRGQQKH